MKEQELWAPLYAEQLNTIFYLSVNNAPPIPFELVSVTTFECAANQEQFSLVFRAPKLPQPVQFLGHLEHEKIGGADMLLVPVSQDEKGLYFEAVYNRMFN